MRFLFLLFLVCLFFYDINTYAQDAILSEDGTLEVGETVPDEQKAQPVAEMEQEESEVQLLENGNIPESQNNTDAPSMRKMISRVTTADPDVYPRQIPSLFFSNWELQLIADAKKGLIARPPTDSEVAESQNGTDAVVPRGLRELSVGGIVYASSDKWTVWFNGQKITPDRLPPEILDIRVYKNHIKVKWYDAYTNQVFPVKLRTQQRFNIDTRIFLPGAM